MKHEENFVEIDEGFDDELYEEGDEEYGSFQDSSVISEETVESVKIFLEEDPKKNQFLMKVGVLFAITSFFSILSTIIILFDYRTSKQLYRMFNLKKAFVYLILGSVFLKAFAGFLGSKIRPLLKMIYFLDVSLHFAITFGVYFYLDQYRRDYYQQFGYIVFLLSSLFLGMWLMYIISTFIKANKIYNIWFGIISMNIINLVLLKVISMVWYTIDIRFDIMIKIFLIYFVMIIYITINSFMVVHYRTKKFYNKDIFYCYFAFWIDWISFFWIDFTMHMSFVKKIIKKRRNKKRRKKKQVKAENRKPEKKVKRKKEPVIEIEDDKPELIPEQEQEQDEQKPAPANETKELELSKEDDIEFHDENKIN